MNVIIEKKKQENNKTCFKLYLMYKFDSLFWSLAFFIFIFL